MAKTSIKKKCGAWAVTLLAGMALTACSSSGQDAAQASFMKIEMAARPTQSSYITGETFHADGGKINVVMTDGTRQELDLTADGVTLSQPDMSTQGEKRVAVTYQGDTTTFTITVRDEKVSYIPEKPEPEETLLADAQTQDAETPEEPEQAEQPDEALVQEEQDWPSSEKVARITIETPPDVTEYFAGDTFRPDGGVLSILYSDRSTATIPMNASVVTVDDVDTSTAGSKKVNVSFGKKNASFTITVVALGGTVTFDGNYPDSPNETLKVAAKRTFARLENDPVREGYTFRGWYEDPDCTVEYEFGRDMVEGDVSVYAGWTADDSDSYAVTYDMNYYGLRRAQFMQYVQAGEKARPLYKAELAQPERSEFTFTGWFTDAQGTQVYAEDAIAADTTLYAGWQKEKVNESYIFEAENVDLSGMVGPGFSGEAQGVEMIVENTTLGASGNQYVSYLYKKGLTLNFRIASSEADEHAKLAISVAAEDELGVDIHINPENYVIRVNGVEQKYEGITLTRGGTFEEAIVIENVALQQGENLIELVTNNSVNPIGAGTYAGTAPNVDYIRLTTDAVLSWDENYGLPANVR